MKPVESAIKKSNLTAVLARIFSDRPVVMFLLGVAVLCIFDANQAGRSLQFMAQAMIGLLPFFAMAIAFAGFAKASGLDQTLARVFAGKPWITITAAAMTGALSPFCSCGVIPVMASMLRSGVPLAPVMAFCIASPVMDPEMFILTAAGINLNFAVAKTITAMGIGLAAGFAVYGLQRLGLLQQALRAGLGCAGCCSAGAGRDKAPPVAWRFWRAEDRRGLFWGEIRQTGWFLGKWLTVAFFLESLMLAYIPEQWISRLVGGESWTAIPLAALVGIPAYLNGFAAIPLVSGLMQMGMAPGAGLAFMTAGAVSSLPAALAVYALVRKPVFMLYLLLGFAGSVAAGWIYAVTAFM